jgi:hypothetical protein
MCLLGQVTHEVFSYDKCEADIGIPVYGVKAQEHTAEAGNIRFGSVKRIISEDSTAICI